MAAAGGSDTEESGQGAVVAAAATPVHAEPAHVPRSPRRRRASQKSGPADQLLEEGGGRTGESPSASQLSDLLSQTLPVRSAASRYAHFLDVQAVGCVSLVPCSDPELLVLNPWPEMEFLNGIFCRFFWAYTRVFSDSSFCQLFYPHFSVLKMLFMNRLNRHIFVRGFKTREEFGFL
jgi:hypothetical protein